MSNGVPDDESTRPIAWQPGPPAPYEQPPAWEVAPTWAGAASAPYGVDPVSGRPWSDRSKLAAGLLQLLLPFLGICGVGRLYSGRVGIGLVQLLGVFACPLLWFLILPLLVLPFLWLWSVADGVVILAGRPRDGAGRLLR